MTDLECRAVDLYNCHCGGGLDHPGADCPICDDAEPAPGQDLIPPVKMIRWEGRGYYSPDLSPADRARLDAALEPAPAPLPWWADLAGQALAGLLGGMVVALVLVGLLAPDSVLLELLDTVKALAGGGR